MNIGRWLKQFAVYWEPSGDPDAYGNTSYSDPVEVKCRWETIQELMFAEDRQEFLANNYVLVDRDLVTGGLLWLGRLEDWSGTPVPTVDGVEVIKRRGSLPDVRAKAYLREVWL